VPGSIDVTTVGPEAVERVRARLAERGADATPAEVARALRADQRLTTDAAVLDVFRALRSESHGAGILDPLLSLPGITDVLVNGPDEVYVDQGDGLTRTDVTFPDDEAVRRLAQRLAANAGRRLDDGCPCVDVRMSDGTRLHAVLAPLSRPGSCLSLRVPARERLSLDELVARRTVPEQASPLLEDLVRSRLALVITGGTGSGKTTLLNALLSLVDPTERIVVIEDAGELRPRHPHVVFLEARRANVEGAGEISLQTLVRQSLRMRPDRLVVGEVRGAEVVDLLAAMNTGHEGSCSTVHANSATDLPARFEALGVAAGLQREAVHSQLASAVDIVLHLRRGRDGLRRLDEIGVLDRDAAGFVQVVNAVRFAAGGEVTVGPGAERWDALLARGGASR
jgi:pilus assembly protein CpaF